MIEIKNVSIKSGQDIILNDVDLKVNSHVTIIEGDNGVGKSSLLNAIYGLIQYDGEIIIDGEIYDENSIYKVRNTKIKYITQEGEFFKNLTIKENLQLFNEGVENEKILEYFKVFSLNEKIINRKMKNCSGGEKQKILLINALLFKSKYLFLDEIDNNLDKDIIEKLSGVLKKENRYIIIISHNYARRLGELISSDVAMYKIVDKKIISNLSNANSTYQITSEIIEVDKNKMSKKNIKKILKLNKLNKIVTTIMLTVVLFLITMLVLYVYALIQYGTEMTEIDLNDNATIITVPIDHHLIAEYGDEKWLETTPYFFTEEDKEKIETLDYVKEVIPIHKYEVEVGSFNYGFEGIDYSLKSDSFSLTTNELNDMKILNDESQDDYSFRIEFNTNTYPKKVYEDIGRADLSNEFLYGEVPNDNSDEVAVSQMLAVKIAIENGYSSIEDIIGETIKLELTSGAYEDGMMLSKEDPTELTEEDYEEKELTRYVTISGITKQPFDVSTSQIMLPYDIRNDIVLRNVPWENENYETIYSNIKSKYDRLGYKFDENATTNDIGKYESFYILLDDADDNETIYNEIYDYDKYIKIVNNYTMEHTSYYQYLSKRVSRNYILLITSLIFMFFLIKSIIKNYLKEYTQIKKTLSFYGFKNEIINKIIYRDFKNIMRINTLMLIVPFLIIQLITPSGERFIVGVITIFVTISINIFFYILFKRRIDEDFTK